MPTLRATNLGTALAKTLLHKEIALAGSLLIPWWVQGRTAERGDRMFRAELKQLVDGAMLKMEGRLVGEWAREAKSLLSCGPVPKRLLVDLTDVSYVDVVGEQVLTWLRSIGARFVAKAVYAAAVCKRLNLPVHNEKTQNQAVFRVVLATPDASE